MLSYEQTVVNWNEAYKSSKSRKMKREIDKERLWGICLLSETLLTDPLSLLLNSSNSHSDAEQRLECPTWRQRSICWPTAVWGATVFALEFRQNSGSIIQKGVQSLHSILQEVRSLSLLTGEQESPTILWFSPWISGSEKITWFKWLERWIRCIANQTDSKLDFQSPNFS